MNCLEWNDASDLDDNLKKYFVKRLIKNTIWSIIINIPLFFICFFFIEFKPTNDLEYFFNIFFIICMVISFITIVWSILQIKFLKNNKFSWACGYLTDIDYGDPGNWKRRYDVMSDLKIPAVYVNDIRCNWLNKNEILGFDFTEILEKVGSPMIVVKGPFSIWPRYATFLESLPE